MTNKEMKCYLFPNDSNNEWISKYNKLVLEVKAKEAENKEHKKNQPKRNDKDLDSYPIDNIGIHHIIPKKIDPSLEKDKDNLLYVSLEDHINLHYYLWKANKEYSLHLWFIYVFARKHNLWTLPGGEEEFSELKKDVAFARMLKKQGIEQ